MGQLRGEGAIFHSNEVVMVATLMTGFYAIKWMWDILFENFKLFYILAFRAIENPEPISPEFLYRGSVYAITKFGPWMFLTTLAIGSIAGIATLFQTNFNVKNKWFKFDFGALNPLRGWKRIFSIAGFVNTGKAIVKLLVILPVAYNALKGESNKMIMLIHTSLEEVFHFCGEEMWSLFWKISYILIAIAIFDYVWGKFQWMKQNKMTKDEVKDERKSVEGDETTKRKIVAKGLQRIMQRLSFSVPKADVVVTNPTHFAVALKYDRKSMKAPMVVAKGKDHIALKIREIARESGVPILERKQLARSLYASVEVGREIPFELFKAVAEVLAYVYRLKNPWGYKNQHKAQG